MLTLDELQSCFALEEARERGVQGARDAKRSSDCDDEGVGDEEQQGLRYEEYCACYARRAHCGVPASTTAPFECPFEAETVGVAGEGGTPGLGVDALLVDGRRADDDDEAPLAFLRSMSFLTQSLTNERTLASFSGASESYESVAYVGRFFSFSTRSSETCGRGTTDESVTSSSRKEGRKEEEGGGGTCTHLARALLERIGLELALVLAHRVDDDGREQAHDHLVLDPRALLLLLGPLALGPLTLLGVARLALGLGAPLLGLERLARLRLGLLDELIGVENRRWRARALALRKVLRRALRRRARRPVALPRARVHVDEQVAVRLAVVVDVPAVGEGAAAALDRRVGLRADEGRALVVVGRGRRLVVAGTLGERVEVERGRALAVGVGRGVLRGAFPRFRQLVVLEQER